MKDRKKRKLERLESGEKAPDKNTIESMRKFDETTVEKDDAGKLTYSINFLVINVFFYFEFQRLSGKKIMTNYPHISEERLCQKF